MVSQVSRPLLVVQFEYGDMDETFVRELLADHQRNPRNYGQLPDPDIIYQTENPQCVGPTHPEGDQVTLQVRLSQNDPPIVKAVRFTGTGCTLSQAGASLITEQMVGTPVKEVLAWDAETIQDLVGMDLTPSRLQCAELALAAFRQGISEEGREAE